MPSAADDRLFGGQAGSSAKAHANMVKRYGRQKGEQVYQATLNKRRGQGKGGIKAAMKQRAKAGSDGESPGQ